MNTDELETLEQHANILRSVWMMSAHRPLSSDERRMLMDAIEAVEEVVRAHSD